VLCDDSEASLLLAQDLLARGRRVVLFHSNALDRAIEALQERGAVIVRGESLDYSALQRMNLAHSRICYMLSAQDTDNLNHLLLVERWLRDNRRRFRWGRERRPLRAIIRVIDPKFEEMYAEIESNSHTDSAERISLRLVNL